MYYSVLFVINLHQFRQILFQTVIIFSSHLYLVDGAIVSLPVFMHLEERKSKNKLLCQG